MIYISTYLSPLGNSLLAADDIGLTGLWFEGQKYFANTLPDTRIVQETKILTEAKKWLDIYFSGEDPTFTPPLHPSGSAGGLDKKIALLELEHADMSRLFIPGKGTALYHVLEAYQSVHVNSLKPPCTKRYARRFR